MKIIAASFFWQNDKPGGLGFTFGPPDFTPDKLEDVFNGPILKTYLAKSDEALGTEVVADYLAQLEAIGLQKLNTGTVPMSLSILAALNIIWLVERGFIPNDEFNGYQFIKAL
jgi:hypothetical protein